VGMPKITDLNYARLLDREDPLAGFRKEFHIGDPDLVYLDGNSLGRLPLRTKARLEKMLDSEWGEWLIRGWDNGWMDLPSRLGGKIARLIGAREDEVLVCDATSVNLFKLAMAALKFQKGRSKLITDELNFPSDLYVLQGIVDFLGKPYELEILPSDDGIGIAPEKIRAATDNKTALLSFTHTYYKSAFLQDMVQVTAIAHEKGAMILWDISHSVGSVPLNLNACGADLAVGCTYKYLNGGPGSPAFLYVRRDLQDRLRQPVRGWLGSESPFEFGSDYEPAVGIRRFQVGTPPVLSMASMEDGLDLHLEAGMDALRGKSIRQTEYMIKLFDEWLLPLSFTLGSPRDPGRRGSHVSIKHPHAREITDALIRGTGGASPVIPDFRRPDNIRLGIAPIYNTYQEVYTGMLRIKEVTEKIMEGL
jgi:kynureninase